MRSGESEKARQRTDEFLTCEVFSPTAFATFCEFCTVLSAKRWKVLLFTSAFVATCERRRMLSRGSGGESRSSGAAGAERRRGGVERSAEHVGGEGAAAHLVGEPVDHAAKHARHG